MGATWFECHKPGCTYKAKQTQHLKHHRAARHNIDVVWFACNEPGCGLQTKFKSALMKHLSRVHDKKPPAEP